jgi:hypothetical protein
MPTPELNHSAPNRNKFSRCAENKTPGPFRVPESAVKTGLAISSATALAAAASIAPAMAATAAAFNISR